MSRYLYCRGSGSIYIERIMTHEVTSDRERDVLRDDVAEGVIKAS